MQTGATCTFQCGKCDVKCFDGNELKCHIDKKHSDWLSQLVAAAASCQGRTSSSTAAGKSLMRVDFAISSGGEGETKDRAAANKLKPVWRRKNLKSHSRSLSRRRSIRRRLRGRRLMQGVISADPTRIKSLNHKILCDRMKINLKFSKHLKVRSGGVCPFSIT